jgi:hypothetical protein
VRLVRSKEGVMPGPVRDEPGDDDGTKIFFIIFVDAIFTTLFERPFTNVFDVMAPTPVFAWVYPARITG